MVSLQPGDKLQDKYMILQDLGTGGWSKVYLAENIILGWQVAIKSPKRGEDSEDYNLACQLFAQETYIGFRLTHPNIVRVYELMEDDIDRYLVMEYAEGGTLAGQLKAGGPLSIAEAMDVSIAICQALDYVHRHGIVHGDMRPSNILLVVDRDLADEYIVHKLSDFGFAVDIQHQSQAEDAGDIDDLRPLAWPYIPPEHLKEETLDGRADIYSLGITLYEMLTGVPPFPLKNQSREAVNTVIQNHLEDPPISPRRKRAGLCVEINQTVLKMLEKNPADRYENAAQLLEALYVAKKAQEGWEEELEERYQEAIRLFGEGKWQPAVEKFEELLADKAPYDDLEQLLDKARKQVELAKIFETAMHLMEKKKWKEAIQKWKEILSQDENYRDGEAKRQQDEAETQIDLTKKYQRALGVEKRKQWGQAIRLFSTILSIRPGYEDVSERLANAEKRRRTQVNYEAGLGFLNEQEWDKAIKSLMAVLKDDPLYRDAASKLETANRWKKLEPLYERAMIHYNHKRWDRAIELLEEVVAGDVGFRDAAQRLHQAKLIREGKLDESKADAVEEKPDSASGHRGRTGIIVAMIAGAVGVLVTKLIDATLQPLQPLEQVALIVGLLLVIVPAYILWTRHKP